MGHRYGCFRGNNTACAGDPMMRRVNQSHGHIVAYIILSIGISLAIWMIQTEVYHRTSADLKISSTLQKHNTQRIAKDKHAIDCLKKQVKEIHRINSVQNETLFILSEGERKSPQIFNGAEIPDSRKSQFKIDTTPEKLCF